MKRTAVLVVLKLTLAAVAGEALDFGFVLEQRWSPAAGAIHGLCVAPDASWFVALAGRRGLVFALDRDGRIRMLGELSGMRREPLAAAASPDGKTLAVVDRAGGLYLFERSSLRLLAAIQKAHAGRATAVAFSADGSYVITGGEDGRVRVWTASGQAFADLTRGARHEREVLMVAALPQGRQVLTVGRDRQVILWQIDTQQALRPTRVDEDVLSAALAADGKTLALGLQALRGNLFRPLAPRIDRFHPATPDAGTPSAQAHEIKADDRVRLIDAASGVQLRDLEGERQDLAVVAVTPDGRFVAGGGSGRAATIWEAASGRRITSISGPSAATAIAFAPDGKLMLAGDEDGSLALYRLSGVGAGIQPSLSTEILLVVVEPSNLVDDDARGDATRVANASLTIRGTVTTASELKSLQVNGQEITALVRGDSGEYRFTAHVSLPDPGRHRIEVVAVNLQGTTAHRTFVVDRSPQVQPPSLTGGRRLALIVGVSRYADHTIDLDYAADDARALGRLLTDPALGPAAFASDDVRLLLDDNATVANINTGLREFLQRARENDFVLFFFAGHGAPDPNRLQDLYLLAHDTNPKNIGGTGLLMRHVREAIAEIPARDVLILTDACHSAGIAAPSNLRGVSENAIHQAFLEKMQHASGGLAILTASEAAQASFENVKWDRHGVFTYFLLQGLRGAADRDGDHIVTLGELMEYVRDHVREATREAQIPAIGPTSFDRQLPLAIVPTGKPRR
jgi:WD40 repeat protein